MDFSDPERPKTCLEVDFPILPVNQVAAIEGNAGKPIYQMSKWWARRRSSVFRSLLIAAAAKAPHDPAAAAKVVWDCLLRQPPGRRCVFPPQGCRHLHGWRHDGGRRGTRLGMELYGTDLNPVAWFVVRNELSDVKRAEVEALLADIEDEVRPQIMPFYACECPRGPQAGRGGAYRPAKRWVTNSTR